MIGEYKINRTTRRCSVGNRPLLPGEYYYSVVTGDDDEFRRIDIAADAWTGPPEGCIGHWKNRVPLPEEKKRELAPPEVLVDLLRSMADQPAMTKMRYLLALMLLRKRHLKPYEDASLIRSESAHSIRAPTDAGPAPAVASLQLESSMDGSILTIEVADIASNEAESLQEQLIDLLYRDVE
jgi:hypothetical protein